MVASTSSPESNRLRMRDTRTEMIDQKKTSSAPVLARAKFANSGSTGRSGFPRPPGTVPVSLIIKATKKNTGPMVVSRWETLSVHRIDQAEGSLRISPGSAGKEGI